ncbi:MAG: 50S ribosomal protein L25 [Verrucomicrobia bacterium]|jgi:large subunit ribosomal protein L25|nr:50S ribosomal protein L25 [Verrucomicrobiota bacterium]
MKSVSLKVYPRAARRRNALRPLRDAGRIPAVIYGTGQQPESLEIKAKDLDTALHEHVSETLLVDLTVESDARPQRLALVQEVQHHPLSRKVLHVDFREVSADKPVTVSIPVEATGEPVGVKTGGGVLEHVLYKVKVRALPRDLPEALVVDVSHLEVGRSIHLGELQAPPGCELIGHKELVVLACAIPRAEAEPTEAEAAAAPTAGDVEMIKEKKEAGEGEAPAAKEGEKKPKEAEKKPKEGEKKPKEGEKK